jgi:hypothetical protein
MKETAGKRDGGERECNYTSAATVILNCADDIENVHITPAH